jgi:septal ring factor EnvC (AmiA/AmiB activator)
MLLSHPQTALKADKARLEQELADRSAALTEHQQRVREATAAAAAAKTQLDSERQTAQRQIGELQVRAWPGQWGACFHMASSVIPPYLHSPMLP